MPRQGAPDEPPQAASRPSLPEPTVLEHAARFRSLAAYCSYCAPLLRRHRTTPFGEQPRQVSLFHLLVLRRNANPLLGMQDLTGVQSASLIGRQHCTTVSPTVTSSSSRRRAAPRCCCLWDLARQVHATPWIPSMKISSEEGHQQVPTDRTAP
jgi:hypothetical protein